MAVTAAHYERATQPWLVGWSKAGACVLQAHTCIHRACTCRPSFLGMAAMYAWHQIAWTDGREAGEVEGAACRHTPCSPHLFEGGPPISKCQSDEFASFQGERRYNIAAPHIPHPGACAGAICHLHGGRKSASDVQGVYKQAAGGVAANKYACWHHSSWALAKGATLHVSMHSAMASWRRPLKSETRVCYIHRWMVLTIMRAYINRRSCTTDLKGVQQCTRSCSNVGDWLYRTEPGQMVKVVKVPWVGVPEGASNGVTRPIGWLRGR